MKGCLPLYVYGYTRVSTEEQAESGLGLAAQRTAIEREAGVRGWTLRGILEDGGVSATARDRPALTSVLNEMERGAGLVVARLDRLARSIHDFSGIVARSTSEGWTLLCLDPQLDFSTPTGRLIANVLAAVSEWERDIIAQRVSEALQAKKARGERIGAAPRISAPVAEQILALANDGYTMREVAAWLNAEEVPTPNGGAEWRPSSFQRLLTTGVAL